MDWDSESHVFCGNSYYRVFMEKLRPRGSQEVPPMTVNVMLLGKGRERRRVFDALKNVSQSTDCLLLFQNFPKFFRDKGRDADLRLAVIDTIPHSPNRERLQICFMEQIHVIVLVLSADQPPDTASLLQYTESLFGPDWHCHTVVVFTRADQPKKSTLRPSDFLSNLPDSVKALTCRAGGGFFFLDHRGRGPCITGRQLREQLFHLSAQNHHKALKVICSEVSSDY